MEEQKQNLSMTEMSESAAHHSESHTSPESAEITREESSVATSETRASSEGQAPASLDSKEDQELSAESSQPPCTPVASDKPVHEEHDLEDEDETDSDGEGDSDEDSTDESVTLEGRTIEDLIAALESIASKEMTISLRRQQSSIRSMASAKFREFRDAQYRKRQEEVLESEEGSEEEAPLPDHPLFARFKELTRMLKEQSKELSKRIEHEQLENLKAKQQVVDKIRELCEENDMSGKTTKLFYDLRDQWRAIGLVPQAEAENLYESYQHQVQSFYDLLKINRDLRDLDHQKNFEEKTLLCERAEDLLKFQNPGDAYNVLQELYAAWKECGPVAREKSDEIWARFEAAAANVKQRNREYQEARSAELESNYVKKQDLVRRAQEKLSEPRKRRRDWFQHQKDFEDLMTEWRGIGPVPRRKNREIWEQFIEARKQFQAKRSAYEAELRVIGPENVQRRLDLCVQAESMQESTDWQRTHADMQELRKQWSTIGYTPRKESHQLYERFNTALDNFYQRRRAYFDQQQADYGKNLASKEAIIKELEAYSLPENHEQALEWLKAVQKRWSAIGHVPARVKDSLYLKYRDLLDTIYDKLNLAHRGDRYLIPREGKSPDAPLTEDEKAEEIRRLQRRIKGLESDKTQMEVNLSFFTSSKNGDPILQEWQGKVDAVGRELEALKQRVKEIRRAPAADKEQKENQESDND